MLDLDRSQLLAPALALLLVVSAVSGGVGVQPAAATHDCDNLDSLVFFASLTIANYNKCAQSHNTGSIEEVQNATDNQTHLDLYNAGTSQKAAYESSTQVYSNYLQDTEGAAWMEAEAAIAQAYENDSSKAVAKSKARQAIADYYAVKEKNLIEQYNTTVASYYVLRERVENESGLSVSGVFRDDTEMTQNGYDGNFGLRVGPQRNTTVTLSNGTTVGVRAIAIEGWDELNGNKKHTELKTVNSDWEVYWQGTNDPHTGHVNGLYIKKPDDNYQDLLYLDTDRGSSGFNTTFSEQWERIQTQNDALQAEVDPFVNNTWTAYESGQINASDVLSSTTMMTQYGADYSNDSGNLYNTVAALSTLGLDSPNLNGTGTMTIQANGVEYHGLVMAREAPNGSWEANTTYNASNITGPVFVVTTDGKKFDLSGEFTISSISSTDGSQVQNVTATKVVYKTSNTSELLEKMERIEELRKEVEAQEQAAASGGGSGSNIDPRYLLGALAIVGLLAYGQGQKRGD